ncbi:hypothetical protein S122051_1252 [Staphylococcus aureus subsp. aureus 122051]|nr:hypothetical protein Newbould305_1983 [Staphylococcus aureus subsp. aureus str. Newbould 305]EOR32020.1 hypothetical protein S091751_2599 [Staphylococcus aureus subsp. aureus 091751]EOR36112.1 hypothetical protein S103564_0851 [Staphylococcus aureus subsp. aureus 103564]EOR42245.1 hypothetical protein MRGR3_0160 [Staphylococcus aureus subsp. aureus MRGR3]EOR42401.1 hypothetical protein S122051_1252 [Staphylococcus aureus subsp. aureus 122051]EOR49626.1 hypothetical protein M140OLGA_0020 [St
MFEYSLIRVRRWRFDLLRKRCGIDCLYNYTQL